MRYSMKAAMLAVAAAAAVLAVPHAALAATPSCGKSCVDPYAKAFGARDVLDVYKQSQVTGQPVILFPASNNDPAEDWTYSAEGTVSQFLSAGLVSSAIALQYGPDEAYEIQYSPYGTDTGLCLGTGAAASDTTRASLQPCGVTAKTVWIADTALAQGKYAPLINGSDLSFSHPYVLTYPASSSPTDKPRPQLFTHAVQQFAGGTVYDTELWSARVGVLP